MARCDDAPPHRKDIGYRDGAARGHEVDPNMRDWKLLVEFAVVFVAMPLAFRNKRFFFPPLPALWLVAAYCLFRLLGDPGFDRRRLWNVGPLRDEIAPILATFGATALVVAAAVYFLRPQLLFNFVRRAPAFWALVVVLYPVLSVYPQGVVFRAYLFHRFGDLFRGPAWTVLASALAFAFVHIIFESALSVALTFAGGLLFAWRYWQTGSLFVSSFEHALYGCFMFTIGLGQYFYRGAR